MLIEKPLISVIIPVYNAQSTLDRCLGSIVKQSYNNLEIIVVDDGSKDDSLLHLYKWAEGDTRIVVVSQSNKGAAAARNTGIRLSNGEYISFVDADDYLEIDLYKHFYESLALDDTDIVSCAIKEIYKGDFVCYRSNRDNESIINGIQALNLMLRYSGGIRTVIWDKLYKKEILKDVLFDERYKFCEDALFNFCALMKCKEYKRISYYGYTYDHRGSQVTSGKWNSDNLSNIYAIQDMKMKICDIQELLSVTEYNLIVDALSYFEVMIFRQLFHALILDGQYRKENKKDYIFLREMAIKVENNRLKNVLGKKDILQWKLYIHSPRCFILIHKINQFLKNRCTDSIRAI